MKLPRSAFGASPRIADRRRLVAALAAGALGASTTRALAQDDRSPVTVLVGAASSMDFTARLVSEWLREALGRPVVTVSKLGAGGRVALAELRGAPPDGRTLMLSTSSAFTINPNIYTNLDYDPVADFTPIAGVSWFDVGIATGPMTGATSMRELVAWAKSQRGDVVYGAAPGTGSASHFAGIAMAIASGLPMTPVPYKDSGQAIADTVAGRLPIIITGTSPLAQMHKAGRLRLLCTSGDERSPLVPEVPTLRESGVDASIVISAGLYGPARMPADVVARIHQALQPMFARTDLVQKLAQQGMATQPMTGAQLAASLESERRRYAHLVAASGYVRESI